MTVIRISQPPGVTPDMYDAVNAAMGVDEDPPDGLLIHAAGDVNGTWQIIDVWESDDQARRFDAERLGPAVGQVTGMSDPPAPSVTIYEAHNVVMP